MGKFYEDLKEGFEEIIAYRKGRITLRSEKIEIPEPPKAYKAKDIKNIREKSDYSQGVFAAILNVSVKNSSVLGIRRQNAKPRCFALVRMR